MAAGPVFLLSGFFFSRREMRAPLSDFAQNAKVVKEKKITEIFGAKVMLRN